jgi:predicted HTH transcriptional regulator
MREILVNAFIHRDYTIAGGAVSLAIFDDRVEVWSAGRYPTGITAEMLTRAHPSVQRNPLIAEVFYRAGLIEKWGRGTNRVAEMCKAAGVAPPEFTEIGGAAVVTFRTDAGLTRRQLESRPESQLESRPESQLESQLESRQRSQPKASEGLSRSGLLDCLRMVLFFGRSFRGSLGNGVCLGSFM